MSASKYIPTTDAEKGIWLTNYTAKLAIYATSLGITPAELASVTNDNAMFQFVINMMETFRQYLSNLTGYKNMLKFADGTQHIGPLPAIPVLTAQPLDVTEGIFDRISNLSIRIKHSTNYSDNIGADLGIIATAAETVEKSAMQPDLIIKADVGRPHLKWIKGHSEAIDLYADHNDGAGFILLGRLTKNAYMDVTALPASKTFDEWSYKAIYVIDDKPVGLYSKVTSIVVKKQ